MTPLDIARGCIAGLLSCLTPEALVLFPLLLGAAGATTRAGVLAIVVGLGLSLVVPSILGATFGAGSGPDATSYRRIACVLLLLQGVCLSNEITVRRFAWFTGGLPTVFDPTGGATPAGGVIRQFLLAILVGVNWIPRAGPILDKASLIAADARNFDLVQAVLIAFGVGAAMPWIVLGRGLRLMLRPVARRTTGGMAGKRLMALILMIVAAMGLRGYDLVLERSLDSMLPAWVSRLALAF